MNKIIKRFFIFILVIILFLAFSGSYTSLSIDNIETVVAIGLDTSTTNNLKVSFQFTNSSSVSESGTTEQSPSMVYSIDASSISSAINLMNAYVGKELSFSHCKLIAISEELANAGISDEIYTLINDIQIRPTTNIVISKCTAKVYIENSKPLFENLLTKYYEVFSNSSKYTGFTVNATIGDFFNSLVCKSCEPYAILGGLNSENSSDSSSIESEKDVTGKSNESNIQGELGTENFGIAVFKQGQIVGELNSIETMCFLTTRNNVDGFLISIPDPNSEEGIIDIYLTPTSNTTIKVKLLNGSPYIKLNYRFSGRIQSASENTNYLDDNLLNEISSACNNYLESILSDYLYKTAKTFKSDINGFGQEAKENFLTLEDFEDYNWEEKYKDSFFDVNVSASIKSSLLLTNT